MKKTYKIPVMYQCVDTFEVEAENLQEAMTLALKDFLEIPDYNYICDSFEFDEIIFEDYPDEEVNFKILYNEL